MSLSEFKIRVAQADDVPLILEFIRELAEYEKLAHEVVTTEEGLDWNRDAIGFYEKLGARAMSDWTVYRLTGAELKALAAEEG